MKVMCALIAWHFYSCDKLDKQKYFKRKKLRKYTYIQKKFGSVLNKQLESESIKLICESFSKC